MRLSRRRLHSRIEDRLHRIDDQKIPIFAAHDGIQQLHIVLRHHLDALRSNAQPFRTITDLSLRFLAGHIEHTARACDRIHQLHRQRRLADPRIARKEHQLTRHQPTAKHTIELADPSVDARSARRVDFREQLRSCAAAGKGRKMRAPRLFLLRLRHHLFHERIPGTTVRTAPHPFWRLITTFLANVFCLRFRHRAPSFTTLFSYLVNIITKITFTKNATLTDAFW